VKAASRQIALSGSFAALVFGLATELQRSDNLPCETSDPSFR